jgi:hypothetical protein
MASTVRVRPGTWGETIEGVGRRPTPTATGDGNE